MVGSKSLTFLTDIMNENSVPWVERTGISAALFLHCDCIHRVLQPPPVPGRRLYPKSQVLKFQWWCQHKARIANRVNKMAGATIVQVVSVHGCNDHMGQVQGLNQKSDSFWFWASTGVGFPWPRYKTACAGANAAQNHDTFCSNNRQYWGRRLLTHRMQA